jgi:hypothetical protein
LGIREAVAAVCAIVGLGIAVICVVVALRYVKPDPAVNSLTSDGLLEIEKDVLATRQRIKSGHVIVSLKDIGRQGISHREYEIFFDGDKCRADHRFAGRLETRVIATDDEMFRVIGTDRPQVWQRGPAAAAGSGQQTPLNGRMPWPLEIPDPRRLGLIVWFFDTINQFEYATHLARRDRLGLEVQPAIRNGERVWLVTFRYKNGVTEEYWLARDKGNLPIYIAIKSAKEPRDTESMEVELSKWPEGDVWFPKKVRLRRMHGDSVESDETAVVEKAEFGREIDEATFKFVADKPSAQLQP